VCGTKKVGTWGIEGGGGGGGGGGWLIPKYVQQIRKTLLDHRRKINGDKFRFFANDFSLCEIGGRS